MWPAAWALPRPPSGAAPPQLAAARVRMHGTAQYLPPAAHRVPSYAARALRSQRGPSTTACSARACRATCSASAPHAASRRSAARRSASPSAAVAQPARNE
eukprot:2583807-Prymnesium_polylepis.1